MNFNPLFCTWVSAEPDSVPSIETPTKRDKFYLHKTLFVVTILAAGKLALLGAECGSSGNTFWTQTQTGTTAGTAGLAVDATNIFWTSASVVSSTQKGTGAGYFSR